MGWSKEPAPAGSLPRVHAQQSRRQEGLEVWRHTPLCLCGLRSLMGEFIILHTSVGRVGSARSFSLGVRTHPQRDVSGLPSSETRGAEGQRLSRWATPASSAQADARSVSTWLRPLPALPQLDSRSLPRVSSRDSAEATTGLRPSLRSPRTSALPCPHDEENIVVCPHLRRGGPESTHFLSSFFYCISYESVMRLGKYKVTYSCTIYYKKLLCITAYYKNYF